VKLTVIGGSAACPNPGDASSSYLIEHDGFSLVLDCGPGSISVLRRFVNLRDVGSVFISHVHSDHTIDLVPFRYGLRYIPGGRGPKVPLWLPPDGKRFLDRLSSVYALGSEASHPFFDTEFEIAEYDPSGCIAAGPFSVRFTPTTHFIPCWAMRIESTAGTLVYLADSKYIESLADFARGADVMICEATAPPPMPGEPLSDGHMTAVDAGRLATLAAAKHLVMTHMWAENGLAASASDARSTFDGAITIARSGVQVQI
jgi:ribonuclease BN (tRNA processing enzyme)